MEKLEWEQRKRQWEAEERAREKERQYVQRELNRMKALPEPVFVLDLPDEIIQKLIPAGFDTVGKALFGLQMSTDAAVHSSNKEDWYTAAMHSRNLLVKSVGREGHYLIGSRLMQFGYLQRDAFLASVREGAERCARLARYAEDGADGSTEGS